MNREDVKKIVNKIYPKIKDHYGLSDYCKEFPKVKLHHNIYARLAGISNIAGEFNPDAEFERDSNTIWIYWPKAKDSKCIVKSIIHEYAHYLQDSNEMQRLYTEGYEYDNHPFEIEAIAAEQDYKLFI